MPFEKGVSGNPTGRPRGIRNSTTIALEKILDGDAEMDDQAVVTHCKMTDCPTKADPSALQ